MNTQQNKQGKHKIAIGDYFHDVKKIKFIDMFDVYIK